MDETTQHTPGQTHDAPARSQWTAAPPPARAQRGIDRERLTRTWLLVLTLGILTISTLTALIAANQAITIWLQPQYAPFVRFGGAAIVAAGAFLVVLRLTRRT